MNRLIARLDRQLAKKGADATLRRRKGQSEDFVTLTVRLRVSGHTGADAQPNIQVQGSTFVMSPTAFNAQPTWADGTNKGLWPERGDFIVYQGRNRHIEQAEPVAIGDEVVRIEGRIAG